MRITFLILLVSLVMLAACKSTTDPTEKNQQLTKEHADKWPLNLLQEGAV